MASHLVGTSLSMCVREIVEGKVLYEHVKAVFTHNLILNLDELLDIIILYNKDVWSDMIPHAAVVAKSMWLDGKIKYDSSVHLQQYLDQFPSRPSEDDPNYPVPSKFWIHL